MRTLLIVLALSVAVLVGVAWAVLRSVRSHGRRAGQAQGGAVLPGLHGDRKEDETEHV